MKRTPYSRLERGTFLIASPEIEGGIYFRSVVLLCEHSAAGSFGLIINKELDIDLPEEMINLKQAANPNIQLRVGGQAQPNQMMLLHNFPNLEENTLHICDDIYLGGDLQFLQEAMGNPSGPSIRLCFGFSSWGPGQLEKEFLTGHWFLSPASGTFIFETPPEKAWQFILRDMGGKYATLSMMPENLNLN